MKVLILTGSSEKLQCLPQDSRTLVFSGGFQNFETRSSGPPILAKKLFGMKNGR
jgi:hypothetical protein